MRPSGLFRLFSLSRFVACFSAVLSAKRKFDFGPGGLPEPPVVGVRPHVEILEPVAARYLPGVDGLRAVAVVAVVLFHLNERLLPGGFVGVDVFFVISGFVVALSALEQRSRTLPNFLGWFYARRAIRILPALIVCLLVSSLMSMLFIPNGFYGTMNNKTAAAAFLGISNIILTVFSDGYFDPTTEYNPFAHTWSLAVEEQFYILAPLLIFAACRQKMGSPGRRRVVWTVAALAFASLLAAAVLTVLWPRFAFFMLPSRFWELAAGVLLALTRDAWAPRLAAAGTAWRLALVGDRASSSRSR